MAFFIFTCFVVAQIYKFILHKRLIFADINIFLETLTLENFAKSLQQLVPDYREKKYLLAVSGGADSMVMLQLFVQANLAVEAAHVNYQLRGEDSSLDAALVKDFCGANSIPFHYKKIDEVRPAGSVQVWARDLRYRFMADVLKENNLDYMVTAHHLNDVLETFLINLSRGSGIRGLAGIPANQNRILRPLLNVSKEEIYRFAKNHEIAFREDASNKKNDYLRNQIRHNVVPELLLLNNDFLENFNHSIHLLNETKNFVEEIIDEKIKLLTVSSGPDFVLDKAGLKEEQYFIRTEILRRYGFVNDTEIEKLFNAENGSIFITKSHRISVKRAGFLIEEKRSETTFQPV